VKIIVLLPFYRSSTIIRNIDVFLLLSISDKLIIVFLEIFSHVHHMFAVVVVVVVEFYFKRVFNVLAVSL